MPCLILQVRCGSGGNQPLYNLQVPLISRAHQSRPSQLVLRVHLRAPVNEDFYNFCVSFLCSLHQGGLTDEISGIHVRALGKQRLNHVCSCPGVLLGGDLG